jgi:hypothetical protein
MNIGKALLRPPRASQGSQTKTLERHAVDSLQAQEAVTYLQRAYALAEKADVRPTDETIGTSARDALRELKVGLVDDPSAVLTPFAEMYAQDARYKNVLFRGAGDLTR